jgi:hypothetical protein
MVLVVGPVITCEVPVMLGPEKTKDEKAAEVDTCRVYEVAPARLFQVRVGEVDCPVAPLAGERRVTGLMVVKLHAADQGEVVPFARALACQ